MKEGSTAPVINKATKDFNNKVQKLINEGTSTDKIIEALKWDKSPFSLVRNNKRNVPNEKYELLHDVFGFENDEKAPDLTQELISSLKKNIEILERVNEDQADRVNRLLKSNSDLMLQLKTNLDELTRNHLTSHAMNEAFHEQIVELLLQVTQQPAGVKMTLIESVHNKGVEKMLAYSERGILADSHT